jgi:proteasome lid subunit RPN8/RPN11
VRANPALEEGGMTADAPAAEPLRIPRNIHDAMVAHCLREAPLECCGILGGVQPRVSSFHPMRNAAASERYDLRLMSSVKDVSDIPRGGKDLIILAALENVFHFRVFDGDGKLVVDTDEKRLTHQARQIEDLRMLIVDMSPPHELAGNEKCRVITAVTSIVGYNPSETRYDADRRDLIATVVALRQRGAEILAIYHSHPRWEAIPSATDLRENHYGPVPRIIVSLKGDSPEVRVWQLDSDSFVGYDLRLMCSVKDASDIPAGGKDLIIVAAVNNVLHFRMFDRDGEVVVDTDETKVPEKARQVEDLRMKLVGRWLPHELTRRERDQIIIGVTSFVGRTPFVELPWQIIEPAGPNVLA